MAKIMIADDMITVQHNLSFILEAYGHTVCAKAGNCTEAITKYREHKPDVILLDILGMQSFFPESKKEIDSFDVIKLIITEDREATIIILTATPKEDYIKKALLLGAKGFLAKGASNEKIIGTIEDLMSKKI